MGKIPLALATGLVAIAISGCDVAQPMKGKLDMEPGIYECKPEQGFQGPTYRFDTHHPKSLVWTGTSAPALEFEDLLTGKVVKLSGDSNLRYDCGTRVGPSQYANNSQS